MQADLLFRSSASPYLEVRGCTISSADGGIGRRIGLKILGTLVREGSIPSLRIDLNRKRRSKRIKQS